MVDLTRRYVQVNGDLELTGTTRQPVISGRVTVDEAIYRLPENRGEDGLFTAAGWKPLDSGLLGPVTLVPLRPRK